VPDQEGWVVAFAERQRRERGLVVHPGRHERELRPPLPVDKGTVVRALVRAYDEAAQRPGGAGALRHLAAFGDDIGDLPAFAALGELSSSGAAAPGAVRVAAVDTESPAEVAARADLTVPGATGAVELLRALADAAGAAA
jgi:trehalose 6-phosphate phosphatase